MENLVSGGDGLVSVDDITIQNFEDFRAWVDDIYASISNGVKLVSTIDVERIKRIARRAIAMVEMSPVLGKVFAESIRRLLTPFADVTAEDFIRPTVLMRSFVVRLKYFLDRVDRAAFVALMQAVATRKWGYVAAYAFPILSLFSQAFGHDLPIANNLVGTAAGPLLHFAADFQMIGVDLAGMVHPPVASFPNDNGELMAGKFDGSHVPVGIADYQYLLLKLLEAVFALLRE